ncbi:carboxylesterase family protein [Ruminococcus sp.]|uniref:carboxylesterase family protein n=1 Tax=Ruminococcus sp. TaxID=41978 RepID=UPI002E7A02BA|nr:carboxylesterase family protein [Ruminococcus sp.]MEE1261821.1 carboxylesterase family protein [Ruminococcus sp.]
MIVKKIIFVIFSAFIFAFMLVVLELNKNILLGFILAAVFTAGFYFLHHLIVKRKNKWYLKIGAWVGWLAVLAGVLFITWPPVQAVPAVSVKNPETTEIISLSNGDLQGVYNEDKSVEVFTGIPYAKPPVGELRWKEPQDPDNWDGVLVADHFAPMSMQPQNLPIYNSLAQIIAYHDYQITPDDNYVEPVSEDSLYLNIWKPAGDVSNLPVMVYIHGGSLRTGQPWYKDYNGESLAKEGVIVVNMGYRLGVYGYFADEELAAESENGTTGNYGMLDQIKALEWVRDNIKSFGGNPDNVTLSGESAGSASVSALCTSPLAKGLFQRVILESSTMAPVNPPHSFRQLEEALDAGKKTKAKFGCESVEELRKLTAEQLVNESYTHHHITVDGYALTETPYQSYKKGIHNESAILHGYNAEESAAFIIFDHANLQNYENKIRSYFGDYADDILELYPASDDDEADKNWAVVYGAVFFDYPHYCLNRLANKNKIPVYEYLFSKTNGRLGNWHSGEEVYCYGNIPENSALYDERDRELSGEMLTYMKNFIISGNPNGDGLTEWKQNTGSDLLMSFDNETKMTDEPKHELFDILDKMDGWK